MAAEALASAARFRVSGADPVVVSGLACTASRGDGQGVGGGQNFVLIASETARQDAFYVRVKLGGGFKASSGSSGTGRCSATVLPLANLIDQAEVLPSRDKETLRDTAARILRRGRRGFKASFP
jgi:hypothetical protein